MGFRYTLADVPPSPIETMMEEFMRDERGNVHTNIQQIQKRREVPFVFRQILNESRETKGRVNAYASAVRLAGMVFGASNYALTPSVQEEFRLADLPATVGLTDIQMPAPVVWVSLLNSSFHFQSADKGPERIAGIAAIEFDTLRQMLDDPTIPAGPGVALLTYSDKARKGTDGLILFGPYETGDGCDLESIIKLNAASADMTGHPTELGDAEVTMFAARCVFNLLLHLNLDRTPLRTEALNANQDSAPDPSRRSSPAKKRKAEARARRAARATYLLIDESRETTRSRPAGPQTGRTVRGHWRQGHYRHQWTGSRVGPSGEAQPGERQVLVYIGRVWVTGDAPSGAHVRIAVTRQDRA
jgi:hypothetical protein